ncbi:DUF726 domain-containing protein [Ponticoccus alexandrii]|uniref:DUF726 domain-containing protein n=1 Tax=Ponticoccus alexandrii TaxID=1943633 RepID=A0ABX7F6H4_9RHOB|nr:DUF726 domain-containing protein [Ponticoccus alexandrii]QRF65983.1 DUF726 domain-containing protein [Ponticoccus alexandrii]
MLRLTVTDEGATLHDARAPRLPVLRHALSRDPGPVTVMIHGYKYQPGHTLHCPHGSIFARRPAPGQPRVVSWPRHLGLRGQPGEGLGISFGWQARGSIWQAHQSATKAGEALADLLAELRRLVPTRPVNLIAHSLGARVALRAIAGGKTGTVNRAILLAAAEYAGTARRALDAPAARLTQVLNVTSRENDLFDFLNERLIPPDSPGPDQMLGQGAPDLPNLVTLQLDDPDSLHALRRAGFPIRPPERLVCHWSPYLRPGVFPLYRAVFAGDMALSRLRALLPAETAPRWSRLMPRLPGRTASGPLSV